MLRFPTTPQNLTASQTTFFVVPHVHRRMMPPRSSAELTRNIQRGRHPAWPVEHQRRECEVFTDISGRRTLIATIEEEHGRLHGRPIRILRHHRYENDFQALLRAMAVELETVLGHQAAKDGRASVQGGQA